MTLVQTFKQEEDNPLLLTFSLFFSVLSFFLCVSVRTCMHISQGTVIGETF